MAWPKEIPFERYPIDLSDEEWAIVEPLLEKANPYTTGRRRKVNLREVLNAIFYLNKTGCQWRYLPKCFPSYTLVSYYYYRWIFNQTLEKINPEIRQQLRKKMVEMSIPVRESLIPKPSKEPRNLARNRDLMEGS